MDGHNASERAREKQASRDADARAVRSGEKSRSDLGRENSFIRADRVRLDLNAAEPLE
jgi:hypothetical protein